MELKKTLGKLESNSDVVNKHPSTLLIGMGWVNQFIGQYFTEAHWTDETGKHYKVSDNSEVEPLEKYEIAFISVPTPMLSSGKCDTSIVEAVVKSYAHKVGAFCIKSTVEVGTTLRLWKNYKVEICMSPEYIGETLGHPLLEASKDTFIILGGEKKVTEKFAEAWTMVTNSYTKIYQVSSKTAELCKLMENSFIATKVMFCNEFYQMAKNMNVDWHELREVWLADPRVGRSHTYVYPNNRGFSGKCLILGTKIITKNGIKNIEDVVIGDEILDENSYTKVTGTNERIVDNVVEIVSRGRSITGSLDHLHFIVEGEKLVVKKLSDIKIGDYVFNPKLNIETIKSIFVGEKPNNYVKIWHENVSLDENLSRLVGLYLAEGCRTPKDYGILWSFGEKELELVEDVIERLKLLGLHASKKLQVTMGTYGISRCWIVRVRNRWFYTLMDKIVGGGKATTKNLLLFSGENAKSLIGGWLDGDGSYYDGTIHGHSESVELIKTLDTMLLSLGINSGIGHKGKDIKISMRDNVKIVCHWTKRFNIKDNYIRSFSYASPTIKPFLNGWKSKVTKIQLLGKCRVFALETESQKYIANNILTHNCLPKDLNNLAYHNKNAKLIKFLLKYNAELRENYDNSVPLLGDEL